MRVLVVEDHKTLAARIAQGLRQAGTAVDVVHDGAAALESAASTAYDVIVLDRDLPVVHGDRVCREMAGSGPRILMLTAAAHAADAGQSRFGCATGVYRGQQRAERGTVRAARLPAHGCF